MCYVGKIALLAEQLLQDLTCWQRAVITVAGEVGVAGE